MPRYVLIEFDSNEQAERFVGRTLEKEGLGAKYRVIGFFAKPRGFCECGPLNDRLQAMEVRRGSKYGWMIHTKCNRPRRQASHSPRNLLDPDGTHPSRTASFLHLVGAWAKGRPELAINQNYPISVRTREDDK